MSCDCIIEQFQNYILAYVMLPISRESVLLHKIIEFWLLSVQLFVPILLVIELDIRYDDIIRYASLLLSKTFPSGFSVVDE